MKEKYITDLYPNLSKEETLKVFKNTFIFRDGQFKKNAIFLVN